MARITKSKKKRTLKILVGQKGLDKVKKTHGTIRTPAGIVNFRERKNAIQFKKDNKGKDIKLLRDGKRFVPLASKKKGRNIQVIIRK